MKTDWKTGALISGKILLLLPSSHAYARQRESAHARESAHEKGGEGVREGERERDGRGRWGTHEQQIRISEWIGFRQSLPT